MQCHAYSTTQYNTHIIETRFYDDSFSRTFAYIQTAHPRGLYYIDQPEIIPEVINITFNRCCTRNNYCVYNIHVHLSRKSGYSK